MTFVSSIHDTLEGASGVRRARKRSLGISLIEMLVAIALGMVVVAALAMLYANVSRGNLEMSKSNQMIENGRFAGQLLTADVQLAGFWGPIDYLTPTEVPDPCLSYAAWPTDAALLAAYKDNLVTIPVQGFESGAPYATCGSGLATVLANSHVLFVRHAHNCPVGAGCDRPTDTGPHVQISGCRTEVTPEPAYVLETLAQMDARAPRIRAKGCAIEVERRRMISSIYYLANGATGIPTLMRAAYENGAFSPAQPMVEGIEAFQVEYGIDDLGSNGLPITATNPADGNADRYQTCSAATPCTLAVLQNTVAVRLSFLARNLEPTAGHVDTKSYQIGPLAIAAPNDGYKRHAFTTTIRLVNPSSRREQP
jgi:type IV pilus assembly protein PilW